MAATTTTTKEEEGNNNVDLMSSSVIQDFSEAPHNDDNHSDDSFEAEEEVAIEKTLAKKESKSILWLRISLFSVLIIATVLVALGVYFYITNQEQRKFLDQFEDESNTIFSHLGTQLDLSLGSLDQLSVSIMSQALDANATLPFYTLPHFALRGDKFLRQTNFHYMQYYPFVKQRLEWENYTATHGREYLIETEQFMMDSGLWEEQYYNATETPVLDKIHQVNWTEDGWYAGVMALPPEDPGPWYPRWQSHTPDLTVPYNLDYLTTWNNDGIVKVHETHQAVIGNSYVDNWVEWLYGPNTTGEIFSHMIYPMLEEALDALTVHESVENYGPEHEENGTQILGVLVGQIMWKEVLTNVLPAGSEGILVYMEDGCLGNGTYKIDGPEATFLGHGNHAEAKHHQYQRAERITQLSQYSSRNPELFGYTGAPLLAEHCEFVFTVYPTTHFENRFKTNNPAVFTAVAVLIFVFTSALFITYDWCVERRQRIVMGSAVRSNEVVASFYPKEVRDRIYKHNEEQKRTEEGPKGWNNNSVKGSIFGKSMTSMRMNSTSMVGSATADAAGGGAGAGAGSVDPDAPIADFYPETTVMFADIAGFTSWSSTREPAAVFILLEGLYQEFDKVAKRMGVFKIETIGDCYLAVCGLPKPRKNHATVMARFAAECRDMFNAKTPELELTLGPGTADLLLRAGLHSGSCTGGVLRGEKCLFTLFGDTVNTASRMESNGKPNRIQVSQATADRLIANGRGSWLTKRDDLITAKGKGKMQTYWVEPSETAASISTMTDPDFVDMDGGAKEEEEATKLEINQGPAPAVRAKGPKRTPEAIHAAKIERLIDWNVSLIEDLLKKLVAHRDNNATNPAVTWQPTASAPYQEVVEVLPLGVDRNAKHLSRSDIDKAKLPLVVVQQLHNLISEIASSYNASNPFHNFEHTSHVTMSFRKLMQRISASKTLGSQDIYTFSFGLDTDPLAEVAVIFATLILNLKHSGIPNQYAALEEPAAAERYGHISFNEQSSLEAGWAIFMDKAYTDLRSCLFASQADLTRFRQLLVNVVMATDIGDTDRQVAREYRWKAAFALDSQAPQATEKKATVVLEAAMQTSVLSHAMQHWTIYQKWNRCLYEERANGHAGGRIPVDPALNWYQGELDFFDKVIVPLATKLEDCRIMGEYSHEFLGCAIENRVEWESEGRSIVEELAGIVPTASSAPPRYTTRVPEQQAPEQPIVIMDITKMPAPEQTLPMIVDIVDV